MSVRELKIDPQPDFGRFEKVLRRQGEPDRVPFYELYSNIQDEVLTAIGKLHPEDPDMSPEEREKSHWQRHVDYMLALGYDYVHIGARGFGFPQGERPTAMTPSGEISYMLADTHTIADRRDFEQYAWPDMSQVDYSTLEQIAPLIPPGMKGIAGSSGVLENVMWLLGYEGISYLIYDDEPLVRDMFDAVGSRIVEYVGKSAAYDAVGCMVMGGDMGFKTQTMLSPEQMREYVFPWHKKIVEAAHACDKPIILHSCGNLSEVMEDIIACGWDAKHSFEDAIQPVWEAKEQWGDRIALLGGFDMDKICRMPAEQIPIHTRFLIEKCAPGGGWALGTGNSVAPYVPLDSFLTMLEEGYLGGVYR